MPSGGGVTAKTANTSASDGDPFADLAHTAKDRARRSLLLEYQSRFKASSPTSSTVGSGFGGSAPTAHVSTAPLPLSLSPVSPLSPLSPPTANDGADAEDDGFDPYCHGPDDPEGPGTDHVDDHDDSIARQVAELHAQIDQHLLFRNHHAKNGRPRASTMDPLGRQSGDRHDHGTPFNDSLLPAGLKPLLRRTDRPVSCPPLASNPFTSLSSALALSVARSQPAPWSAPTSSAPSPSLSHGSFRLANPRVHDDWRPPLPNQWSANVLDDLDFLDTTALPTVGSVSPAAPSLDALPDPSLSPAAESEDPLIRLARDTGPPSPTLSVMSSLAFELAGALGEDAPSLMDPVTNDLAALAIEEEEGENGEDTLMDPRAVPLVAHRTVLDSDTVVTTYAYPQHTNAKRASYMSTTASAAAIARNSTLSLSTGPMGPGGARRTSLGQRASLASDHRRSSVLSSPRVGSRRVSAATRHSTAHSARGSVFIDTEADVIVSSSASVRGSFMELRANMEMDVMDDPVVGLAFDDSPDELDDLQGDEADAVQAATRWSQRFSVPPNPFVDPDDDPLTNPAAWTNGDDVLLPDPAGSERATNASLDALAAIPDAPNVHQGTSHAMLRLMGIREPPAAAPEAALDGYDPDDPHAAILDPAELGLGTLGLDHDDLAATGAAGGLSLEEELADAELKRFSTMLDRVASQIEDLRVADAKLTTSLEKVCARCRVIQTAGPGVREYLEPCSVHGMAAVEEPGEAPSR